MFEKILKKYFDEKILIPKKVNRVEFYICKDINHYGLDGGYILEINSKRDSPSILEAIIKTFDNIRNGCKVDPNLYFGKEPKVLLRRLNDKDAITLFIETDEENIDTIGFTLTAVHIALHYYKHGLEEKL